MPLHLLKLCVGAESIHDLQDWIAERLADRKHRGEKVEHAHTTRMVPKRSAELLDGGSLYWVIKGKVSARQALIDIRPFLDGDGISRCHLVLEPKIIALVPRSCRPFQGWRYLSAKDAPSDLSSDMADQSDIPEQLRRELRELGLL